MKLRIFILAIRELILTNQKKTRALNSTVEVNLDRIKVVSSTLTVPTNCMITQNFQIGDRVYEECYRGFGSGGKTIVTSEDIRYDEKTGEPYRIIACGDSWFKDSTGDALGEFMYYIKKI